MASYSRIIFGWDVCFSSYMVYVQSVPLNHTFFWLTLSPKIEFTWPHRYSYLSTLSLTCLLQHCTSYWVARTGSKFTLSYSWSLQLLCSFSFFGFQSPREYPMKSRTLTKLEKFLLKLQIEMELNSQTWNSTLKTTQLEFMSQQRVTFWDIKMSLLILSCFSSYSALLIYRHTWLLQIWSNLTKTFIWID